MNERCSGECISQVFQDHLWEVTKKIMPIPVNEELKHLHITGKQTPKHGISVFLSLGTWEHSLCICVYFVIVCIYTKSSSIYVQIWEKI